jgi:hypothetical protein
MGVSPEVYGLITRIVDEKVKEIKVRREEFDLLLHEVRKLVKAKARTEDMKEELPRWLGVYLTP